ncbi:MAG TPA: phosphate signaling complex protein PhoU [Polyangia bacterium]
MSPHKSHISAELEQELTFLKARILEMAGLVGAHVAGAVAAMVSGDVVAARSLVAADREVNQAELLIDERCIRILALRQPAASDLRFVAAALKMVTDLERIGDLAVKMAEQVPHLSPAAPLGAAQALPGMAAAVEGMLRDVLTAFVDVDPTKAEQVIAADPRIDALAARLIEDIESEIRRDASVVRAGVATIFFVTHIERIADHATNVAEMIIYLARGRDVRHPDLA